MENGKWIQIKASAPVAYLSDVEAVMGMISNSLMTEDYSDIEGSRQSLRRPHR